MCFHQEDGQFAFLTFKAKISQAVKMAPESLLWQIKATEVEIDVKRKTEHIISDLEVDKSFHICFPNHWVPSGGRLVYVKRQIIHQ